MACFSRYFTDGLHISLSVDWAQLAQQWIQMKDAFPPDQVPPAPPPPPIGPLPRERDSSKEIHDVGTEGGEAPMDMETKEEAMEAPSAPPPGSQGNGCVRITLFY